MIIDTHNRISSSLLQTTQARPNKTAARTKPEAADASLEPDTSSPATLAAQNIASALSPVQDAKAAQAMIQAVRQSFFANPRSALQAQANQLPENALQLLQ